MNTKIIVVMNLVSLGNNFSPHYIFQGKIVMAYVDNPQAFVVVGCDRELQ
jgi:hypothetical protein